MRCGCPAVSHTPGAQLRLRIPNGGSAQAIGHTPNRSPTPIPSSPLPPSHGCPAPCLTSSTSTVISAQGPKLGGPRQGILHVGLLRIAAWTLLDPPGRAD